MALKLPVYGIITLETVACEPRNFLTDGFNHPGEDPARRKRIETIAHDYVFRSRPIFIQTASLRGPFDSGWMNPWKSSHGHDLNEPAEDLECSNKRVEGHCTSLQEVILLGETPPKTLDPGSDVLEEAVLLCSGRCPANENLQNEFCTLKPQANVPLRAPLSPLSSNKLLHLASKPQLVNSAAKKHRTDSEFDRPSPKPSNSEQQQGYKTCISLQPETHHALSSGEGMAFYPETTLQDKGKSQACRDNDLAGSRGASLPNSNKVENLATSDKKNTKAKQASHTIGLTHQEYPIQVIDRVLPLRSEKSNVSMAMGPSSQPTVRERPQEDYVPLPFPSSLPLKLSEKDHTFEDRHKRNLKSMFPKGIEFYAGNEYLPRLTGKSITEKWESLLKIPESDSLPEFRYRRAPAVPTTESAEATFHTRPDGALVAPGFGGTLGLQESQVESTQQALFRAQEEFQLVLTPSRALGSSKRRKKHPSTRISGAPGLRMSGGSPSTSPSPAKDSVERERMMSTQEMFANAPIFSTIKKQRFEHARPLDTTLSTEGRGGSSPSQARDTLSRALSFDRDVERGELNTFMREADEFLGSWNVEGETGQRSLTAQS